MSKTVQFYLGVDLHKTVAQVCVLNRSGEIVDEIRARVVDQVAGDMFIDHLEPYLQSGRVAIEAIGVNRWFVNRLLERGIDVVVCDPVKLNLKVLGKKTDKRDAHLWDGRPRQ